MNRFHVVLVSVLMSLSLLAQKPPKIVALVPVRNEGYIMEQCLRSLAMYTDAIVVLDDASEDNTLAVVASLAKECRVERILVKSTWFRDEPGDRNALLAAGRSIGGTHFVVIDADEMFTANCLWNGYLRKKILSLEPGDQLEMRWLQLWLSVNKYRTDDEEYKSIIFCDDGECYYKSGFIHTPRVPLHLRGKIFKLKTDKIGFLHFSSVNLRNVMIKRAWYQCIERIRQPQKSQTAIAQYYNYFMPVDRDSTAVAQAPAEWFDGYTFYKPEIFDAPEKLRERQVMQWFEEHGKHYFAELDVWDIDWGAGLTSE